MINKIKRKILFLPRDNYPLKRNHLFELFISEFSALGNEIHWIALGKKSIDNVGNNFFHRIPLSKNKNISLIQSIPFRILKLIPSICLLRRNDFDIIITSDGLIEGYIGLMLKYIYKKKLAYYLTSLFHEMDIEECKINRNPKTIFKSTLSKLKKPLYLYLIKKADYFHPISKTMRTYFFQVRGSKATFSLPMASKKIFFSYRKNYLDKSDFDMIYIGQLTSIRRIDMIIDIISEISKKFKDIKVLLIGQTFGSYSKILQNKIKKENLSKNIIIKKEVTNDVIPIFISRSSFGLSILPPILPFRMSSPTKVTEYLSIGLPVLANREIVDQKQIIEKSSGGVLCNYEKKDIVDKIEYLLSNSNKMEKMGVLGRDWISKNRNYHIMAKELDEFYDKQVFL